MKTKELKNKLKIDFKSLKFKVWLTFILFSILIIGLLWISQVFFLQYYLNNYKENELKGVAEDIIKSYGEEKAYFKIANNAGCSVEFITKADSGYTVNYTSNGLLFGGKNTNLTNEAVEEIVDLNSKESFKKDSTLNRYIYAKEVNDNTILVVGQSADLSDSTVHILQIQMIIATIAIIALAFCISIIMSGILTRDTSKLSQSAKRLAQCDYNVVFDEKASTEISEIASTLNYATREIQKVDGLRKELIANVSHDLRTPLTLIKGYAELIKEVSGDNREKRNEQLDVIIKETDRLAVLVRDMLNISEIEGDKLEVQFVPLDLSELVQNVYESFLVLNEKEGFNITCDIEENLMVLGDETRLQLATYNLISNAVNYTGEDKKVSIVLKNIDNKARFTVTDTGNGIPDEQKNQIWERYYRAKEHKRSVAGSGLGLSIVKNALILHNANFGIDNAVPNGSIFWYELPLTTGLEKKDEFDTNC